MATPKYVVDLTEAATKEFAKLPKQEQKKVASNLKRMEDSPTAGAAILKNTNGLLWRKKLGDSRIIFGVTVETQYVRVVAIRMRKDDTYDDLEKLTGDL